MKIAHVKLRGIASYSQSRYHETERKSDESDASFEERTWRERTHVNSEGNVIIPPMAFAKSIAAAAKYKAKVIPGKGKQTWTKHFEAGILNLEPPEIKMNGMPIQKKDIDGEWLFVPSNGVPGGGKRVKKHFPFVREGWECELDYHVLDDQITEEIFEEFLVVSGKFIGIGRFRPQSGGFYGRFEVIEVAWPEV